jgi:hypothetical protein
MDAREPMEGRIRGHSGVRSSVISCIETLRLGLQCRGEKREANEVRVKAEMGLVRDVA